jgi:hypothetical protein
VSDVTCAEPECETTRRSNSAWDDIRAHDAGWFAQKDGTQWCPEHTPAWVAAWRARRKQAQT